MFRSLSVDSNNFKRLKEWGNEINRRFSNPIATTSGDGNKLELKLPNKQEVNHVIIQENIKNGERIRKYKIEAFVNGKWKSIGFGECVGHKRIQQLEPETTNKIRLVVEESIATPQIKNFSVFYVD